MITEQQREQILSRGMSLETVEEQIRNFKTGFPYLNIQAAATIGNGIKSLTEEELSNYVATYEQLSPNQHIVKFVPASGAASRMFKDLYSFLESEKNDLNKDPFTRDFFENLSSFSF